MMHALPSPPRRRALAAALLLVLSLAAGGCGPGVGGSGTGNDGAALAAYGAIAAPVCSGEIAAVLDCRPGTGPGVVSIPTLPLPVVLADRTDGRRVQAQIDEQRLLLEAPCSGLVFVGLWAQTGRESPRFYGVLSSGEFASAQAQTEGGLLQITVRDSADRLVAGPLLLQRVSGTAAFGSCS